MASSCKNCGATLVFHPDSQLLVCEYCNSSFRPEEIETEQKASVEEQQAVSMNEAYGTEDEKLLDCYIYTCNHCGGEIIINGTEASTKCIYCGNSAVVFSRISKQRRPDVVLPFTVTKEKAIAERIVRPSTTAEQDQCSSMIFRLMLLLSFQMRAVCVLNLLTLQP